MHPLKKYLAYILVLLAFAGTTFAVSLLTSNQASDFPTKDELKKASTTVALGETARINSDESSPFGDIFFFSGEMDVKITEAQLYSSYSEALDHIELDGTHLVQSAEPNYNPLLCKVKITNVSATSEDESKTGKRWFNITDIFTGDSRFAGDLYYFDGMPAEGSYDAGEYYYFNLEKGESREYTIVFMVDKGIDLSDLSIKSGTFDGVPKYRFKLTK